MTRRGPGSGSSPGQEATRHSLGAAPGFRPYELTEHCEEAWRPPLPLLLKWPWLFNPVERAVSAVPGADKLR